MKNLAELQAIKDKTLAEKSAQSVKVAVGMATCGLAAGARPLYDALNKAAIDGVSVGQVGCVGLCQYEPLVEVVKDGVAVTYVNMDVDKINEVIEKHLKGGNIVEEYTAGNTDLQ